MITNLLTYGVPFLIAVVAGGLAGGLTARRLGNREPVPELAPTETESDPFTDAAIEMESIRWQEINNQPPEAAGLMAARLKTLHKIGKGKGWL